MRGFIDKKSHAVNIQGATQISRGERFDVYLKGDLYLSPGEQTDLLAGMAASGVSPSEATNIPGQFAIVVHEKRTGRVSFVRDHIGQQPIFTRVEAGGVAFSTSLAQLKQDDESRSELNLQGLCDYLVMRRPEPPHTLVSGISLQRPGTIERFTPDGLQEAHSYQELRPTTPLNAGEGDAAALADYRAAFQQSVETICETVGGREIAVLSSGGIDSSVLVAAYRERSRDRFRTFYVGCTGYKNDRAKEAEYVSRLFDTKHENVYVDGRTFAAELPKVINMIGMPLGSPSTVLRNHLYATLKGSGLVLLSGEGADSLYGGYYIFDLLYRFYCRNAARIAVGALAHLVPAGAFRGDMGRKVRLIKKAMIVPPDEYFLQYDTIVHINAHRLEAILANFRQDRYQAYYKSLLRDFDRESILNTIVSIYQSTHIADYLQTLSTFDEVYGIQHRHPFISVAMRDAFNRVSWERKTGSFKRKKLILEIAREYLPPGYFNMPKEGFGVPVYDWFRDRSSLGQYVDLIGERGFRERGLFEKTFIDKLLDDYRRDAIDHADYEDVLWPMINLALWFESWGVGRES